MRILTRSLAVGLLAATNSGAVPAHSSEPSRGIAAIACTNPHSGTTWQIRIDYDRATVDSNPARIRETDISWHDTGDGGNYTLDRRSGDLTVVVASSTGGYFLHDRCKLDN